MRTGLAIVLCCVTLATMGVVVLARDQLPIVLYRAGSDGGMLLLWIAAMTGWGAIIRSCANRKPIAHVNLLDWIISAALGIGAISLLILILGLLAILSSPISWVIIAAGIIGFCFAYWKRERIESSPASNWNWLFVLVMPVVSIVIFCAFIPPGALWGDEPQGYDVLEYHLQVPREWYEAGKIAPLPHNVFSYFPFSVEMQYLLAMHLRGGPWAGMYLAQLMHACMIALTVLAISALTRESAGPLAAAAATLSMCTAPWLLLLAPIAYDEGGLLLFGTIAIGLIWRALREEKSWKDFALAGAMAGFACGTKLTAVPMLLLAIPLAVVFVRPSKKLAAFITVAFLVFSPWLARNLAWAGNPVFPEATKIFGRGKFTDVQQQRWQHAHEPTARERPAIARLHSAGDQIIWDWRFGYALIPLALFAIVLNMRRREMLFLLSLLLLIFIIWIAFTHLQSRFFVLAIPICALAIAGAMKDKAFVRFSILIIISLSLLAGLWRWHRQYSGLIDRFVDEKAVGKTLDFDPPEVADTDTLVLVGSSRAFLYARPMIHLKYRTVFDINESWSGVGDAWQIDPQEIRRLSGSYFNLPPIPPEINDRSTPFIVKK